MTIRFNYVLLCILVSGCAQTVKISYPPEGVIHPTFDKPSTIWKGEWVQVDWTPSLRAESFKYLATYNQVLLADSRSFSLNSRIRALTEVEWTHVLITVRDSGPGLNPKSIDRLFDAFYTTKSHGLGMGLAISRSIIAAHRGKLWAKANAPRGAVFQFMLPVPDTPDLTKRKKSYA
jgi:light-regulated signal transduction histidine kinase (bacteriophytochrome)